MVAFAQLTGMICMPLFMSTGLLTQYYAGREIIRKIDAEVPAVEDDRPGDPLTLDAFTYRDVKPLGEKSAGYGVSFIFETGKKYLVIGASGSGKSTLFKPLLEITPNTAELLRYTNLGRRAICVRLPNRICMPP